MKKDVGTVMDRYGRLIQAFCFANGVGLLLFFVRVVGAENFRFWFLFWNLLLAAVPLVFSILLVRNLRKMRWMSWQNVSLTFLWLGFLPNSFYIATDLIHIHLTGEINILFDVVLFLSCIFNGYVLGFVSLYMVHRELLRHTSRERAHTAIALVLLACSFAIYLGRYLRWNTWDVLVHPVGILFDVSNRIINPGAYPQTITTTVSFFLLLASMYWVIYELARLLRSKRQ